MLANKNYLFFFTVPPIVRPPPAVVPAIRSDSSTPAATSISTSSSSNESRLSTAATSSKVAFDVDKERVTQTTEVVKTKNGEENATALPEGFFDDPFQDAKVNIESQNSFF